MGKRSNINQTLNSTLFEKIVYAFGDVGNISWLLTASFLTVYYTDCVGLDAAFMGTMMLLCRVFDGVSDLMIGTLVDKTRSRWGKARPWILFVMIPLNISVYFMFNVPQSLSGNGLYAYTAITYFLTTVVFYTAINIAYQALLPRFSLNAQDRNVIGAIRTLVSNIVTIIVSMIIPVVLNNNGGYSSQETWTLIVIVLGMISIAAYAFTFCGIREKASVVENNKDKKEVGSLKVGLKALISERYFYIAAFLFLAFAISGGATGINLYFARDVLKNDNLYGVITLLSFGPMLLGVPFVPMLFKKFGKRNTICVGLIISVLAGLLNLTNPYNVTLYFVTAFLRSMAASPMTTSLLTLAGDIVDYNQWKYGIRTEGLATSANSIGSKLGTGLGAAVLGWGLKIGGYNGTVAVQSQSTLNAIIAIAIGLPVLVTIIAFVLMLFWNLEKYEGDIKKFLNRSMEK
ncbi:MAG: MFS transporter [Suipraeoptans sp.]